MLTHMPTISWTVEPLSDPSEADIHDLANVLIDCVEDNASVSFIHPLSMHRAVGFWSQVADRARAGARALLIARDETGICGTVQLVLDQPENQSHRADLSKMLVHRRARRSGCGSALLAAAEETARASGKTLVVLDTQSGSQAEAVYLKHGWIKAGEIPNYALTPKRVLASTTIMYREL